MCGIAGVVRLEGRIDARDRRDLARMLRAQAHRGPDGNGSSTHDGVLLGHVRLAVIDRSAAARQPMVNETGDVFLIANGEVYNFEPVRDELRQRGHRFRSRTDSEVLLHGYEAWGMEGLLSRIRGMYAFALYDARRTAEPVVYLVRDRLGVKPLYHARDGETLVFASEMTALVASGRVAPVPSRNAAAAYLALGSVPGAGTAVEGVETLPPGHYLELRRDRSTLSRYWEAPEPAAKADARDEAPPVEALLEEAVRLRLVSDVPLGVFSSGGIDSAALVAVASGIVDGPVTTLTVVFDDAELNEARYAREVARRYATDHREIHLDERAFAEALPDVFRAMDSPSVDGVNTFFVSRAAREAGLTVVLSGLGGDEVFLGYPHFRALRRLGPFARALGALPPFARKAFVSVLKRGLGGLSRRGVEKLDYLEDPRLSSFYLLFRGLFTPDQIEELFPDTVSDPWAVLDAGNERDLLSAAVRLELGHYLPHQLLRDTDVMSMAHSLEARVPLLDHVLVEALARRPHASKLSRHRPKPLLLDGLKEPLPREVWDRPKQGFTLPFGRWMRGLAPELKAHTLAASVFDPRAVDRVFSAFAEGRLHWSRPWALVAYSAWHERLEEAARESKREAPVTPVVEVGAS